MADVKAATVTVKAIIDECTVCPPTSRAAAQQFRDLRNQLALYFDRGADIDRDDGRVDCIDRLVG